MNPMKPLDRSLIQPAHMRNGGAAPQMPAPQQVDLGFFVHSHQFLSSIPAPKSDIVLQTIAHLETQICNALLGISIGVGPMQGG